MSFASGTELGRYEIRSKLGEVYLALDTELNRRIAIVYIARGEKDKAFELLEAANKDYDLNIMRMKVERRFDPIRSDPLFDDLARRIGLP